MQATPRPGPTFDPPIPPSLIFGLKWHRETGKNLLAFNISGARGLYMNGAVQRQMRDALGVAAHISFSFDAAGANFGRVALDLPNENPLL